MVRGIERLRQAHPQLVPELLDDDASEDLLVLAGGREQRRRQRGRGSLEESRGALELREAVARHREAHPTKRYPKSLAELALTEPARLFASGTANALELTVNAMKRQVAAAVNRERAAKRRRLLLEESEHS